MSNEENNQNENTENYTVEDIQDLLGGEPQQIDNGHYNDNDTIIVNIDTDEK